MNDISIYKNLKLSLTKRVIELRKANIKLKANEPRFVFVDKIIRPDGAKWLRKKIILMSKGCSVPTCTMCPFTNESNYNQRKGQIGSIVEQVEQAITKENLSDIKQMSLYNDGSFFAPNEISEKDQIEIAKILEQTSIKLLSIESLPQFITKQRVDNFMKTLGNEIKLEIGIGLQSADSFVRELCVNTSFSNETFENSINLMHELGITPKIYVLIKPPFLSEEESINDVLNTLNYLKKINVNYITLCPVRISKHTIVWDLYERGYYKPLNLWSI